MSQLKLDFTKKQITSGKREHRITITCNDSLKSILDQIIQIQDTDMSKLGYRYLIEGIQRDIGDIFMAAPHLKNSLEDIVKKFF